jgi:site-specific recombinase XerC
MPDLAPLVLRYVRERRLRGELTKETAAQYESRLLHFADALAVPSEKVVRRHVLRWMEAPNLSAHYRRARLSAVRGFCQWCVLNGYMSADPTLGIPLPKLPALLPLSHGGGVGRVPGVLS